MGTRQHKWRATNTVYVDIKTGSDLTGDGSQYKPYQSYTRALYHYQPTAELPTSIPTICLAPGIYTGQLSFGCTGSIIGTQWGTVIIDLQNKYTDYGFYHSNIIVMNGVPADDTTPIGNWTNRDYRFAGVGSASVAAAVGVGNYVSGVSGSSVLIHNTPLYWGCIHNSSGQSRIYSCLTHNSMYKLTFGGNRAQQSYDTYYKLRIADQRLDTDLTVCTHFRCLFADFDMFVNNRMTLSQCFFTSDCNWYYKKGSADYRIVIDDTNTAASTSIVEDAENLTCTIGGGTVYEYIQQAIEKGMSLAQAKLSAIPTATQALYVNGNISTKVNFSKCVFSTQTAADTFNNADVLDFTLKLTSEAAEGAFQDISKDYYGALPPALNIAIRENSDGQLNVWESRSFKGLLKIDGDKIIVDEDSAAVTGEGRTKVIPLDTLKTADKVLTGVYSMFGEKFTSHGLSFWENWDVLDTENQIALTAEAQTLTKGVANAPAYYIVSGDENTRVKVVINGDILEGSDALKNNQVIFVASTDTVTAQLDSSDGGTTAHLIPVLDSNMPDCLYVRMQQTVYAKAKSGQIKSTATYLNSGAETITYNGHQIITGESFEGVEGETEYMASDGYEVDVLFDDDSVSPLVPNNEWIPASFWDSFYIRVNNISDKQKYYLGWNNDTTPKAITTTKGEDMAVSSSGNYLSRVTTTGQVLYLGEKYLQFRLFCKKVMNR